MALARSTGHALIDVVGETDWRCYHAIRRVVLWEERGLSGYDDARPEERLPHHHPLLLTFDGRGVGTIRLDDLRDGRGIVRLVAINRVDRGQGHGRILGAMAEDYARALGIGILFVNAALNAEGYYGAIGWSRCDEGAPKQIVHSDRGVRMTKCILLRDEIVRRGR